jgi:hypothetical protein
MVWCMDARPKLAYPPVAYVSHSPPTLPPLRSIKRSEHAMSESDDIEIVENNIVDAR